MTSDYDRIRQAILFINDQADQQPDLETVAKQIGISPAYLQRVFHRWAGVSPKRFLQYLNATRAKQLLRDSVSVLDTAFEIGLSGPGRLHDLTISMDAVSPGQYARHGEGISVRYGVHDSPFGQCLIGVTERGINFLRFLDDSEVETHVEDLQREWHRSRLIKDQKATAAIVESIFQHADRATFLLHLKGTNFQLKVWEALLKIPESCLISYQNLARRMDEPAATRAVASAVGRNPVAYLIPCHRVLRSSGALGGFRWGLDRKQVMLARELMRGES